MKNILSSCVLIILIILAGCSTGIDKKDTLPLESAHYGIDISHYQGDLIFTLDGSSKLRFIISKATQGDTYLDAEFDGNWKETKQRGFIRGAYHFYMASDDIAGQVENFSAAIGDLDENDIAPIVDIEKMSLANSDFSNDVLQRDFLKFLTALELKLKRKPMIYTDYHFAQKYLLDPKFAEYDLWLAEYSGSEQPMVPETWTLKGYKIWQKSDTHAAGLVETDFDEYVGLIQNLVN